jgi:signal peptidase I
MLLPEELPREARRLSYVDPDAVAWLELRHSPTLPPKRSVQSALFSLVSTSKTWIPLFPEHIQRLTSGLYTARLVIHGNHMSRYYFEGEQKGGIPLDKRVPDGTFEFFHGKAFEIGFGGTSFSLDKTHSLYPTTPRELALLFNTGIDVSPETYTSSSWKMPSRFAYFRDGAFVVMGVEVFSKDDEVLQTFEKKEMARQGKDFSYFAFLDKGSPDKAPLDVQFFKNYGFKVPENHYLLLGDNPVMSVDSRYFGPVPEENIQGSPILLFWPFGRRMGSPSQPPLAWSPYSLALSGITILVVYTILAYQRKRRNAVLQALRKET